MEDPTLGAIKLRYNNEVIKIKDLILQAKVRGINNLSRKLKVLKTKKGTEVQLEKNKRKIDSFISEIKLLKTLHRNDVANFAMDNIGNLNKFINTPAVTKEKAMARLLLREPLHGKCKELIGNFSIVPTAKLLEQNPKKVRRKNRLKALKEKGIKKEGKAKDPENNIKESKIDEPIKIASPKKIKKSNNIASTSDFQVSFTKTDSNEILEVKNTDNEKSEIMKNNRKRKLIDLEPKPDSESELDSEPEPVSDIDNDSESNSEPDSAPELNSEPKSDSKPELDSEPESEQDPEPESSDDEPFDYTEFDESARNEENRISKPMETNIDPFFVKKGGNDYVTLAVPRPPDKIVGNKYRDESSMGNRKMRRAAKFNRDVQPRERRKQFKPQINPKSDARDNKFDSFTNTNKIQNNNKSNFNERIAKNNPIKNTIQAEEKLHPSWEAKKQKSSILPFKGNKIVFD